MGKQQDFAAEVKATFQDRTIEKFWWYLAFETDKNVAKKVARSSSWARPLSKRRTNLTQSVKRIRGGSLQRVAARAQPAGADPRGKVASSRVPQPPLDKGRSAANLAGSGVNLVGER